MQEWDEILLEIMQEVVVEVFGFSFGVGIGFSGIVPVSTFW